MEKLEILLVIQHSNLFLLCIHSCYECHTRFKVVTICENRMLTMLFESRDSLSSHILPSILSKTLMSYLIKHLIKRNYYCLFLRKADISNPKSRDDSKGNTIRFSQMLTNVDNLSTSVRCGVLCGGQNLKIPQILETRGAW